MILWGGFAHAGSGETRWGDPARSLLSGGGAPAGATERVTLFAPGASLSGLGSERLALRALRVVVVGVSVMLLLPSSTMASHLATVVVVLS